LRKKLTSLICLYGLVLSFLTPLTSLAQTEEFEGFFEDISLLGSDGIYEISDPENENEEQELVAQYMLELMDMQSSLCRETNGKYKLTEVINPISNEAIDCSAFTLLQYQLIETENSAEMAFRCISIGRKPIEALGLLKSLGIEAEKHFNCPGKDQDTKSCVKDLVCNTIKSNPMIMGLAKVSEYAGVPKLSCDTSTDSNCLTEAFWGIWKNLVTSADAVWSVVKLGWKGIKSIGKALCFFCESHEPEDHAEFSQHMIGQQQDGFFKKFLKSPVAATTEMMTNLFSSFKQYIGESIGSNFGCAKWSSNRFDPFDGEEAYCEDPVISWDCASCDQKMNMACGVIGFVGGEILTSMIAGKALAYGAKVAEITKLAKAGSKLSKTKLMTGLGKGTKFVGTKITGVMSFGKNSVVGIVKASGKWAIKVGGKLVPLNNATKAKMLQILAAAGKYGKRPFSVAGKGGKRYLELLEESFVLGYQGKHGLKALQTSRKISHIEKQIAIMRMTVNPKDLGRVKLIKEQLNALQSLKEYREILKVAVASKGDKMSHISKMKTKLSEYLKRKNLADKHSIALKSTSHTSQVKRFTPSLQEKAYEAVLIKEGVSAKFVKNVATKSEVKKIMSANKERLFEASQIAGRKLSKLERQAIIKAHYTGTRNIAGSFSRSDMAKKVSILRDAGLKDISRGLMQSNVTGVMALYPIAIQATESITIIQAIGITGTSAVILDSLKTKLTNNEVIYVGDGRFVTNNEQQTTILLLDPESDKELIQSFNKKLSEVNNIKYNIKNK
jgi:hypothetical protein